MISVIIPNFNAEKYIEKCVKSVLAQDVDKEIIIIDDGSTDSSKVIIQKLEHAHSEIKTIFQQNMNASVARNAGLNVAKGEYVFFLDSDDELEQGALRKIYDYSINNSLDLCIGNYNQIDDNSNLFNHVKCCNENKIYKSDERWELINSNPNPSNKLFNTKLIKEHNIHWGNVRIGQDLNFFLKYMLFSEKVGTINCEIYSWRNVLNGISNSVSFRIFDIRESLNNVKEFYRFNNSKNTYIEYISTVEFRHYYVQLGKMKKFRTLKERKAVVTYFSSLISMINFDGSVNKSLIKKELKNYSIKRSIGYYWFYSMVGNI